MPLIRCDEDNMELELLWVDGDIARIEFEGKTLLMRDQERYGEAREGGSETFSAPELKKCIQGRSVLKVDQDIPGFYSYDRKLTKGPSGHWSMSVELTLNPRSGTGFYREFAETDN